MAGLMRSKHNTDLRCSNKVVMDTRGGAVTKNRLQIHTINIFMKRMRTENSIEHTFQGGTNELQCILY